MGGLRIKSQAGALTAQLPPIAVTSFPPLKVATRDQSVIPTSTSRKDAATIKVFRNNACGDLVPALVGGL